MSQDYYVRNINLKEAKYIFILESPHVQEVKYGVPVAGPSGKMMTKILFEGKREEPLGKLMLTAEADYILDSRLKQIGLLNVCNIPMQASAYSPEIQCEEQPFLDMLEGLRVKYLSKKYKIPEWNEGREMLRSMFHQELNQLINKDCYLIPCGKFASTFFNLAGVMGSGWKVIDGVPHPSRNQWYQPCEGLVRLKTIFNLESHNN